MTLGSRVFYFTPAEGNVGVSLDDRRGAAFDMHGNVYWIAKSGSEIRIQSSGETAPAHFWSAADASPPPSPVDAVFKSATPAPPP